MNASLCHTSFVFDTLFSNWAVLFFLHLDSPARSFGPAVVTCMSTYDDCDDAMGDWYWIYFVGPFAASFLVAEVTNLMQMDVGDDNDEAGEDTDEGVEVTKEDVKDATA